MSEPMFEPMSKRGAHRRLATGFVVLAAVALLTLTSPGVGGVAFVTEVGWWTRSPLASAPDGGFAVGAAPDGPTSVAALRVDVGDGLRTLVVGADPAGGADLASLEVCLAGDAWAAAAGEALEDAPTDSCDARAVPFAAAGGDTWRADVSSLVEGRTGDVSLAVVPTEGSGSIPYDASFEAPVVLESAPLPSSTTAAPTTTSAPATTAAPPTTAASAGASSPPPTAPTTPQPSPTTEPPATLPDATGAATTTVPDPTGGDEPEAVPFEAASGVLDDDVAGRGPRWTEALVLVLLSAAVGAGVFGVSRVAEARR